MPFSIIVLTYNEAINIGECLKAVSWADDVVVVDSFSTDDTARIATEFGARVYQRAFTNFADQRNWTHENVTFKHSWVFHLDADERFTPKLRDECERVIAGDKHSGYFVSSQVMLFGRWVRYSSAYPVYQVRLVKCGEIQFEQVGHGQREQSARRGSGYLKEAYLHFPFAKGIADWFDRHNRYSTQEAQRIVRDRNTPLRQSVRGICSTDRVIRRRSLKVLSARLRFRPFWRFVYLYLLKRGFLDGRAGFMFALLNASYEWMIEAKVIEREMSGVGRGRPVDNNQAVVSRAV